MDVQLPARALAEHLEYLNAHYSILPLSEIVGMLITGKHIPAGTAAITIDDGFCDSYDIAYPLLREHRIPATLFVVTQFMVRKAIR